MSLTGSVVLAANILIDTDSTVDGNLVIDGPLDAVARLPVGHGVTVVARGENLFEETVVTRNAGGSIDLGTPRTLWIGLSFRG